MLLYINYRNEISRYSFDNKLNISLFNTDDINILIIDNKIQINLYNDLYFKDKTQNKLTNKNQICIYQKDYEILLIFIKKLKYKFTKYKLVNEINIGKNLINDIVIKRNYIDDLYGRIQNNTIYNSIGVFVNGNMVKEYKLNIGDVIYIYDLIILYHKDFIMINNPNDILINLEKIEIEQVGVLEIYQRNNKIRFYNGYKQLNLDIKLNEPKALLIFTKTNLITSIGPIITLAIASLSLAIINIYNKQLNTLLEIIPIILFPLVMLLSAMIWQPLNMYLSKKQINKCNQVRYNSYIEYINNIKRDIDQQIHIYKNLYDKSILNIYELYYGFKNHIYIKNKYCNDYLELYLGISNIRSNINITSNIKLDDPLYQPINIMINHYKYLYDFRLSIDLKKYKNIALNNDQEFIKLFLLQVIVYHSYENVKIIIFDDELENHDMSYLCNVLNAKINDELLLINNVTSLNHISNIIEQDKDYICLIFDQTYINKIKIKSRYNIYVYDHLDNFNANINALITVNNGLGTFDKFDEKFVFKYDQLVINIEQISQYISNNFYHNNSSSKNTFYSLHNINDITIDNIYNDVIKEHLIAYIGYDINNNPISLDLSDKAQGPHGLIAGTTGSGKSELISTMILSLAYRYTPKEVSFVIIDYKGSGLISNFINKKFKMKHILKTISNLENDNIKRVLVSIKNECIHRQKLFVKLSNITNVNINSLIMYQSYYKEEYDLEVLGHLVIIIDEFAELKQQYNYFLQELVSVSRIGRSLGLHLILSTQRPTGVVCGEIFANSRFKICLKVNDESDSYEMLKVKDAASLKNPGEFYLKVDDNLLYGKSVLCNTSSKYYDYNNYISILDNKQNEIYKNYKILDKSINQIEAVINSINKYTDSIKSNLWLNPLVTLNYKELVNKYNYHSNKWILGEYDDLDNSLQGIVEYDFNLCSNLMFITNNKESKVNFINSITNYLLNYEQKKLYIIDDDVNIYNELLIKYPHRIILCNNDNNIYYFKNIDIKNSIIIVNNYYNCKDIIEDYIFSMLENTKTDNNNIILLLSNISYLKIKHLNNIKYLIGTNIKSNDIINYFNYQYKDYLFNENNGLIKIDNKSYLFNLYTCKIDNKFSNVGQDIFNKIPNCVEPLYDKHKLLLGYNVNTLKKIYYKNNVLIITGYDKDYLNKYLNLLKKLPCISYGKPSDKCILLLDKLDDNYQEKMIIVKSYDISLINEFKGKDASYLWLGKNINNQYAINSKHKYIESNQGIYIDDCKEELGFF